MQTGENKDNKIPRILKSFYFNINLHSDLSWTQLGKRLYKKEKFEVMMKLKSKEQGYLGMGGILRIKEKDRDWGGCRKKTLESRKH